MKKSANLRSRTTTMASNGLSFSLFSFLFKFEVNYILIKKKAHIICCTFSHILPHSARPTTEFAVLKLDIYIELRKQECYPANFRPYKSSV